MKMFKMETAPYLGANCNIALADSSCSEIRINPILVICDLLKQTLPINPIFLPITLYDVCLIWLICFPFYHKTYETSDPSFLDDSFSIPTLHL